jgi:hypothetical protein
MQSPLFSRRGEFCERQHLGQTLEPRAHAVQSERVLFEFYRERGASNTFSAAIIASSVNAFRTVNFKAFT